MGNCDDCGVKLLNLCPLEMSTEGGTTITWKCFEKFEVGVTSTGEVRKRLSEVHKDTKPGIFIRYLQSKVKVFVKHNFIANWQDVQCREMMRNLPEGVVISHIDFAENYTFQIQNEVQSMYWFSSSISILVHISMQREPSEDGEGSIKKTTHYYLSDDKQHDSLFVQHCLMLHWKWLESVGDVPKEHWVYSDGCSAQFKGATAMYFVARYPGLTNGCKMRWNFFGSGHGKGKKI